MKKMSQNKNKMSFRDIYSPVKAKQLHGILPTWMTPTAILLIIFYWRNGEDCDFQMVKLSLQVERRKSAERQCAYSKEYQSEYHAISECRNNSMLIWNNYYLDNQEQSFWVCRGPFLHIPETQQGKGACGNCLLLWWARARKVHQLVQDIHYNATLQGHQSGSGKHTKHWICCHDGTWQKIQCREPLVPIPEFTEERL